MSQTLLEEVNIPKHYNVHPSGIETINITRNLGCDLGNTWKYLMRFRYKGTPKKDILKSIWYLNDFKKNFIDENYQMTCRIDIDESVVGLMNKVIDIESSVEVKRIFSHIKDIILCRGIIDPEVLEYDIKNLELYSDIFE